MGCAECVVYTIKKDVYKIALNNMKDLSEEKKIELGFGILDQLFEGLVQMDGLRDKGEPFRSKWIEELTNRIQGLRIELKNYTVSRGKLKNLEIEIAQSIKSLTVLYEEK